jgi:hypothetical protein
MSRRRRLTALAVLHLLVLGLGVGVATARDGHSSAAAAYVPPPSFAPEVPVARPHVTPARPKPRPSATPSPSPRATHKAVRRTTRRTSTTTRHRVSSPAPTATHTTSTTLSFKDRMMRAVARIPGYRAGEAEWLVKPGMGNWGMAVMGGSTVWINPDVPADRLYDVVAHEWSHLLMVKDYGGDVMTAVAAANTYFGGTDLAGAERAADCMAKLLGASWTHYTPCTNSAWQAGARRLVARQKL